ncbi:MAG TPA: hypothetical protein VKE23_03005, partial [Candidatus Limnocylindria bacterium]|nr:hypothetical protein [Candidatus Limnocylindria bacterium]
MTGEGAADGDEGEDVGRLGSPADPHDETTTTAMTADKAVRFISTETIALALGDSLGGLCRQLL